MKAKYSFFILLLIAVLLGCIGEQREGSAINVSGIGITNFSASVSSLFSSETSEISLVLINNGDFDAYYVSSLLYNYGVLSIISNETYLDILPKEQTELFYWIIKAPSLPENQKITISPSVKVYYKYFTEASTQVALVPEGYREEVPTSYSCTKSPIKVSFEVRRPVRVLSDIDTEFTLKIKLKNVGPGGVIFYEDGISDAAQIISTKVDTYIEEMNITYPSDWELVPTSQFDPTSLQNDGKIISIGSKKKIILSYKYFKNKMDSISECINSLKNGESCNMFSTEEEGYDMLENIMGQMRRTLKVVRDEELIIPIKFKVSPDYISSNMAKTEDINVKMKYGYETDALDFEKAITIKIQG